MFVDIIKAANLEWLGSGHRQRPTKLSTTFTNVWTRACVSADGGHFEHIMWTR